MFRKITSNRDPRDTLLSELKNEFRPYVDKAGNGLKQATERYPKFLFGIMVVNIVLSAILCFTVFRHREPAKKSAKPPKVTVVSPVVTGFGQIMQAGSALKEMIALKREVDTLSAKPSLSPQDSVVLENALDRLQQLNNQFNRKK